MKHAPVRAHMCAVIIYWWLNVSNILCKAVIYVISSFYELQSVILCSTTFRSATRSDCRLFTVVLVPSTFMHFAVSIVIYVYWRKSEGRLATLCFNVDGFNFCKRSPYTFLSLYPKKNINIDTYCGRGQYVCFTATICAGRTGPNCLRRQYM